MAMFYLLCVPKMGFRRKNTADRIGAPLSGHAKFMHWRK